MSADALTAEARAILRAGRCVSCMEPVNPLHPKCACVRAEIDGLKADAIESEWQQENDRLRTRVADLEALIGEIVSGGGLNSGHVRRWRALSGEQANG